MILFAVSMLTSVSKAYMRINLNLSPKLIHWSGQWKPWMSCQYYLWNQYSVPDPSGKVKSCESDPASSLASKCLHLPVIIVINFFTQLIISNIMFYIF